MHLQPQLLVPGADGTKTAPGAHYRQRLPNQEVHCQQDLAVSDPPLLLPELQQLRRVFRALPLCREQTIQVTFQPARLMKMWLPDNQVVVEVVCCRAAVEVLEPTALCGQSQMELKQEWREESALCY